MKLMQNIHQIRVIAMTMAFSVTVVTLSSYLEEIISNLGGRLLTMNENITAILIICRTLSLFAALIRASMTCI